MLLIKDLNASSDLDTDAMGRIVGGYICGFPFATYIYSVFRKTVDRENINVKRSGNDNDGSTAMANEANYCLVKPALVIEVFKYHGGGVSRTVTPMPTAPFQTEKHQTKPTN